MIDVKKLIVGFLILAVGAGCSGLIISLASSSSGVVAINAATSTDVTPTPSPSNGFAVQGTSANLPADNFNLADASASDPNNMTDALANAFIMGVSSANPSGPHDDGTGNSVFSNPDTSAIAKQVVTGQALQNFSTPDWDAEAAAQTIKTTADSSADSLSQYSASLNSIVNQHFISTGLEGIVSSPTPDGNQSGLVASQIQGALADSLSLQTPTSLLNLQKSLVKVMIYEKNVLALVQTANTDPLRASLVLQNEEGKYDAAVQELQAQMQKASSMKGFSFGTNPQQSENYAITLFDKIVGVQTAHAQWLTFDASNFGEWVLSFVKNTILQILKNTLVALIQQKVLTWLQGNGVPRFITNWGVSIVNAYTQRALNAINGAMQCVYPAFAPQIRVTLNLAYQGQQNNVCSNSFQAALGGNSLNQFMNNFQNGGWAAFDTALLPDGNPYGALWFAAQTVGSNAQSAQQAFITKSIANQGQKGDQACADGSDPNGTHTECLDQNDVPYNPNPDGTCDAGLFPVTEPNNGYCTSPQSPNPEDTTPGLYTGFAVNSALDASPKLVTAANDIAGLLNALLSSLLTTLANQAISVTGQAVNGGIRGINPGGITGGGQNTIPPVPLGCNPPSQTVSSTLPVTLGAAGGKNDANGNPPQYTWAASNGTGGQGFIFTTTFTIPGTYTVLLNDSTGDPTANCRVIVQ